LSIYGQFAMVKCQELSYSAGTFMIIPPGLFAKLSHH